MAPIGCTRASPARTDWRTMKPTAAWLSVTGSVFGMAHTVVNPPAAAARAPLAGKEVQPRHPDRHTVRHLIEDHAVGSVGHARVDLHAAIHGPRVHDSYGAHRLLEPLGGDAEDAVVLPHARDESHLHPFELEPEHIQHVGPLDRLLDAPEPAHAQLLDAARE